MNKQLKLKNYHLVSNPIVGVLDLYNWFARQKLHGKESRFRVRFMKLLEPRVAEIDPERIKLCEEYCERDKDGKIIYWKEETDKKGNVTKVDTTEKEGTVGYKILKIEEFNKAYFDYLQEEFIIDITPANRETVYGARDIILNTTEEFSGRQAIIYDEWCLAFEEINQE